ncbi:MAG: tRNA lysidine(34) synthetase TilS [Spirochaetae bacterium HGW-Spirochaetae-9]|nr:MAG: tRNA lysidine(34) synthetase TilS [Spirochaetae bacterium HGW-Spirochaetae-9]
MRKKTVDSRKAVERQIEGFFSNNPYLRGRSLLVAYSGGMDSSTLLTILAESGICPLRAVHIVHNLRPAEELALERTIIVARCRELKLPLTIATVRAGAIEKMAKRRKIGIEAAAREVRYGILERCALRFGIEAICTAHNADDQLETLLSRFLSSSSINGLVGIQPSRSIGKGITLLRPLLSVPRSAIERYADSRKLPFSTDSTNCFVVFRRNRIRHTILPLLDREFPGWRNGLLGTSKKLEADKAALDALFEKALAACSLEEFNRKAAMPMDVFAALPLSIRMRMLARWISSIAGESRISAKALQSALAALAGGASGVDVLGTRLIRRGDMLKILPILDFHSEDGYFFVIPSEGVYGAGPIEISLSWGRSGELEHGNGLAEGSFTFPLRLRNRKAGDAMKIAGVMRRLDDVMKTWHLEGRLRNAALVVEDRDGIVALLPSAIDPACCEREKFRDYAGLKNGRRLYIRIKGA